MGLKSTRTESPIRMTGQYKYRASPPTRWKLSCIVKPKNKKYQHGSWQRLAGSRNFTGRWTYLSELPPIQKVTGIIFENKNEIDLIFVPNAACKRKKEE